MKPPPRKRSKPDRNQNPEPPAGKAVCQWLKTEQMNLLNALKLLGSIDGGRTDLDYRRLRKSVPTRSISEIQSMVEFLKNKVISSACTKLRQQRFEEKKGRKPIEVWTHMASTVTGSLEEPISTAFSQMLIVSSTEPRTLIHSDLPQARRPYKSAGGAVGSTIGLRRAPVQGPITAQQAVRRTPPTTTGKTPAHTQLQVPAAAGRTPSAPGQRPTEDERCSVDFERLYCYLSTVHKPDEQRQLTPMESAIVLDLLMSLPEELPLLDCNKLLKHLRQTYHCLSSRVGSAAAQHLFEDLKKQRQEASEHHLHKGASADGHTATQTGGSQEHSDAETGAKKPLSDAEGNGTPSHTGHVTGPSCPPLNPFMVPVNLLRRR